MKKGFALRFTLVSSIIRESIQIRLMLPQVVARARPTARTCVCDRKIEELEKE